MTDAGPPPTTRAVWPDPLFLEDLAAVLGVRSRSAARRIVLREGIPFGHVARRIFVRRAALAAWFDARETVAEPRPGPLPVPAPPPWAVDLLKRRRGPGS